MSTYLVRAQPLTPEAFEPYGEVIMQPPTAPDQDFPAYRYWDRIVSMDLTGSPPELAYVRMFHRPFKVASLERHRKATQTFVPVGCAAGVVVVAPGNPDDAGERPDPARAAAFFLDGKVGYHLKRGTWHQSMFPTGPTADYVMVVRRDNIVDDQEIRQLDGEIVIVLPT